VRCRVVVATHLVGQTKSRVGVTRNGVVYELFFTTLPQENFTATDVVELYLHRGAFEPALADEDQELETPCPLLCKGQGSTSEQREETDVLGPQVLTEQI